MTTFDSTKTSLKDLLRDIRAGKIQLPNFQRGWVWDDGHIRDLLFSVGRSFPIGAVMLLEAGGEVRFQTRPVEGLEDDFPRGQVPTPQKLILDGQQRLTTLTQAIYTENPVRTKSAKGKRISRHYYFDMTKATQNYGALDEAIVAVDENRQLRTNFGKDVVLDLSTRKMECEKLYFPCNLILNSDGWLMDLHEIAPEHIGTFVRFSAKVLEPFRQYHIPVIQLNKETSKEAVCIVFEKVNTGGVTLTVFELVTASFAAKGKNLRADWEARKSRIEEASPLLQGIKPTDFLQAISLLYTGTARQADIDKGKPEKRARPVSAKRADVLKTPLEAWTQWANALEDGFQNVARFLRKQFFYRKIDVPYATQIVPLAAVITRLGDRWLEPRIYEKLARWFWSGVLGELYGSAAETRMANDYVELLQWIEEDASVPRTVSEANFQPERLDTLRTRRSAAYKGINVLVLREGAEDWFWKASIRELDEAEVGIDIHHVFPIAWCEENDIDWQKYDSILNKVPISYKANRMMGGKAPSQYVQYIQETLDLKDDEINRLLESHALSSTLLRNDSFTEFVEDRRRRLCKLVEKAMGKPVTGVSDAKDRRERPSSTNRSEDVKNLIENGETGRVEFKSSAYYSYRPGVPAKVVTESMVKAVAAFLNSEGGILVVGVADDGQILGVQPDLDLRNWNPDRYVNALTTAIHDSLGPFASTQVEIELQTIGDQPVALVHVSASPEPIYARESGGREVLFARVNNSSRALHGPDLVAYTSQRWPSQ